MNLTQRGLITLLRSAISGDSLSLPEGFSLEDALGLIRSHGVVTLAYAGACNCGIPATHPVMQPLFSLYCKALLQSENQLRALEALFAEFDSSGIDYMPLKGCNMKPLYPKPELRLMGDADVLIREGQYESQILPVMKKLGYAFRTESDHEIIWTSPALFLELHKRLIPSYNKKFHDYFSDGWTLAKQGRGSRYALPPEEEFAFLFTHFAKHYRDGGIGCRHVVDLWVYRRSFPELEEAQIRNALKAMGLLEFYENLCRMMDVWFEDGEEDHITIFLTDYIFSSGSFGDAQQHILSMGIRSQQATTQAGESRLRYILSLLFPRRTALLGQYPVLKRLPWLLPLVWLWRGMVKLFTGWSNLRLHLKKLKLYTQKNLDRQRAMLHYVGLRDKF